MSRGGRGGGRNTGGRMGGQPLPFNIDPELEAEAERKSKAADGSDANTNNIHAELFPELDLISPAPPTAEERKWVQMYRIRRAKMRASPFWTGDAGMYASKKGHPDMPGGFDPFEDGPTFSNGKRKRETLTPNLKGVKNIYPQFFPKELRHLFEDPKDGAPRLKKLALARQSVKDRLAKFDDDAEDAHQDDDDDAEEGAKGDEDGEDAVEQPVDSSYEEDDDDEANDYNAEQYFDDGDADGEDYGAEDYGDDG